MFWIEQNWLQATISERGKRRFYTITPEALKDLYNFHQRGLMKRGMRNLAPFEAYVEYCFAPKHTVGEQLLDVRRDKNGMGCVRSRGRRDPGEEDGDGDDAEMDGRYRVEMAHLGPEPGEYDA
jgi:hypothetical protein